MTMLARVLPEADSPPNVSRRLSRVFKAMQPKPSHPIDVIWAELSARGWTVRELAARIPGAALHNRGVLLHYLKHPTRELELGAIWAAKLDGAFGLGNDFFLNLEKAWRAHRRVLADERRAKASN